MIVGVERFFKAAIVDRNTSISSAALVSAYHLHPVARDVIKRWANEAAEAVQNKGSSGMMGYGGQAGFQQMQSSSAIVQYHALGLLYLIRQGDRMAVTKMIQQLSGTKGSSGILRSPNAICMLIRFAAKVMEDDPKYVVLLLSSFPANVLISSPLYSVQRGMYELIEGYLKHKSDMVNYEAARAICEMKNVGASELHRPIAGMSSSLSVGRPLLISFVNLQFSNSSSPLPNPYSNSPLSAPSPNLLRLTPTPFKLATSIWRNLSTTTTEVSLLSPSLPFSRPVTRHQSIVS